MQNSTLVALDREHLERAQDEVRALMRSESDRYAATFETVRILRHPCRIRHNGESDRRDKTARFLADACNRIRSELQGDIHWLIEDDILVPLEGGTQLFSTLTADWVPCGEPRPMAADRCSRVVVARGSWMAVRARYCHTRKLAGPSTGSVFTASLKRRSVEGIRREGYQPSCLPPKCRARNASARA